MSVLVTVSINRLYDIWVLLLLLLLLLGICCWAYAAGRRSFAAARAKGDAGGAARDARSAAAEGATAGGAAAEGVAACCAGRGDGGDRGAGAAGPAAGVTDVDGGVGAAAKTSGRGRMGELRLSAVLGLEGPLSP